MRRILFIAEYMMNIEDYDRIWNEIEWRDLSPVSPGFNRALRHRFARAIQREAMGQLAQRWEIRSEDANHFPSPAAKYPDLSAFHSSVAGEGEHAYNWKDKPHRLVYDLTRMVAELRDEILALAKD